MKSWRTFYAEHNGDEQVLLHYELYGNALQIRQNIVSYMASVTQGIGTWRGIYSKVKESKRLVRLFSFYRISFSLYEKHFVPDYQFMKIVRDVMN